ncbi:autotransporter assembly complex protein TamA [Rhizobium sp. S153]|uniref:Autotransporter assembly complex protein TamA n=1 Tax=Ciceribacter sichuanensis TaxID=2949647 RepID=A0ABT0V951_9HYPH|nr:autotransporter assembly complex family protein [Ciceribacter sp. S153]MCM2402405.1 autotransporter assembly complex protein TamA [Ciceribacter sp. S153]
MPSKLRPPIGRIAFRTAGTAVTLAASLCFSLLFADEAYAFKIFGITIFGDDETEVTVIDPVRYTVTFDTDGSDKDLADSLDRTSLLVSDEKKPVSGDLGVVIKARDDRDRLIATLYENARYGGIVTVTIAGQNLDALPPNPSFDRSTPVPVSVRIDPGPLFTIGDVTLEGDAARLDPGTYDLRPGGPAGSLVVLKAGSKIIDDLKAEGRPLVHLTKREVVADHETNTIDVVIAAEAGPVASLGPIAVKGARKVDEAFIRRYSRLQPGQQYSPEQLRKAGERLRALGVLSSVNIEEADKLSSDGALPLGIVVSEGKHRYFGFGANWSSIDGAGLQGYWGHRNLFGQAESLRLEGAVTGLGQGNLIDDLDYSAGITFVKPGAFFPSATLEASLKGTTLTTDSYDANSIAGKVALAYEISDHDTVSGGLSLTYDDIDDAFGNNRYLTFGVPISYIRDTRDNKLNPTEGYYASVNAIPSYEITGSTIFSSFEGSVSGYYGIGAEDRVVLAARLSAGTLLGAGDLKAIPATRRFYAGGGGSVRGYAYQEVSPYNDNDDATGGRSYALGSFEARVSITEKIGIVPFLDIGSVSTANFPDFSDLRMGAGVGLRYMTPFGPLRLDVAMPLDRYDGGSQYGIYAGIGQSF